MEYAERKTLWDMEPRAYKRKRCQKVWATFTTTAEDIKHETDVVICNHGGTARNCALTQ